MSMFILTFLVFLAVVIAMSVGALVDDKVIKGSCGGLNNVMGKEANCEFCGGSGNSCSEAAIPPLSTRQARSQFMKVSTQYLLA